MLEEVYVNELLDLKRGRGDILDYVGEERQCLRRRLSVGHLEESDYSPESLQDIALGSAVEKLLELARGQFSCGRSADIAGIAGGFEGKVAGCLQQARYATDGLHDSDLGPGRCALLPGAHDSIRLCRQTGGRLCRVR